jgi:hypothetical protein
MVQPAFLECCICNTWNYDVRRRRCAVCETVARASADPGWLARAGLAALDAVLGGEPARVTPRHTMVCDQWVRGGRWVDTGRRVTRSASRTLLGLRLTRATRIKPVLRYHADAALRFSGPSFDADRVGATLRGIAAIYAPPPVDP